MNEEDRTTSSPQRPFEEAEPIRMSMAERSALELRAAFTERIIRAGAVLATLTVGFYVLLYFQTRSWQILANAASLVLGMLCLIPAYRLVRRWKLDAAGYWLLSTVLVVFGGSELFWAGTTVYFTLSVLLLLVMVGSLIRPRRRGIWVAVGGLYAALTLLINWFEPLPRYDVAQSPVLRIYTPVILLALILAILWQIVRAYQHTTTIRTRLLGAFVSIVLLPAIAIGASSAVLGWQSGRRQAIEQLELTAAVREAELNVWINRLQTDLEDTVTESGTTLFLRTILEQPDLTRYQAMLDELRGRFQSRIDRTRLFEELFVLNLQGQAILSTEATHEATTHSDQTYFQEGLERAYVQPPFYSSSLGQTAVFAAHPLADANGQVMGVLVGRANTAVLNEIMLEKSGLGQTGKAYLLDRDRSLLTPLGSTAEGILVRSRGADAAVETQVNGAGLYKDYQSMSVVGAHHWLPELQVALLAERDQSEAFGAIYTTLGINAGVALIAVLLAALASLLITRSIARPLGDLAETASQIAAGNLALGAKVEGKDEIGLLARAFNSMTSQLRELIGSLEQRVADRTHELEATAATLASRSRELEVTNIELEEAHRRQEAINRELQEVNERTRHRAAQLQAVTEVSQVIAQVRDLEQLLPQVTQLLSQKLGFYHTGIFLVDQVGRYAVLRAANSEGGQHLLARGHKLAVDARSVVGYVTATGEPQIIQDVAASAAYSADLELPDTRSQMGLPLRVGGQTIGALDVQSVEAEIFDESAATVLGVLAGHVAIAIENARLLQQAQQALAEVEEVQRRYLQQTWAGFLRQQPDLRFEYRLEGVPSALEVELPMAKQAMIQGEPVAVSDIAGDGDDNAVARAILSVPIKLHGQVIGVIDLQEADEAHTWTDHEIALAQAVAGQMAQVLESARLFEQAQTRAHRETVTRQITDRIRDAMDVDAMLQTAIRELGHALGAPRVYVRLATDTQVDGEGDGEMPAIEHPPNTQDLG